MYDLHHVCKGAHALRGGGKGKGVVEMKCLDFFLLYFCSCVCMTRSMEYGGKGGLGI